MYANENDMISRVLHKTGLFIPLELQRRPITRAKWPTSRSTSLTMSHLRVTFGRRGDSTGKMQTSAFAAPAMASSRMCEKYWTLLSNSDHLIFFFRHLSPSPVFSLASSWSTILPWARDQSRLGISRHLAEPSDQWWFSSEMWWKCFDISKCDMELV